MLTLKIRFRKGDKRFQALITYLATQLPQPAELDLISSVLFWESVAGLGCIDINAGARECERLGKVASAFGAFKVEVPA